MSHNLSEILFKPQPDAPETSMLVRRAAPLSPSPARCWYRLTDKAAWIWRGVSPRDILAVQARIVMSDAPRSGPHLYDTVIGYRAGNWVYEWCQQAMFWQQRASAATAKSSPEPAQQAQTAHLWRKAASLYSIAAYPYLKGDILAEQAQALANRAWQRAAVLAVHPQKNLDIPLADGKTVSGMLHMPANTSAPYACVLMCGELDGLQNDYYRFFEHYLAPRHLAMLTLDMPGVGASAKWSLNQDSSQLHQQALDALRDIPWIDHQRVAAFGFRFGANVAVRLGWLSATKLKAIACLSPMVHSIFTNQQAQSQLPVMCLDVLASRSGMNNATETVLRSELARYSLKLQGLLGRSCPVAMLACYWQNDPFSSPEDARLIAASSSDGKLLEMSCNPLFQNIDRLLTEISQWLQQQLS